MANATADKATSGAQPRAVHAGAMCVRGRYIAAASHSATDVIQMVKVPDKAIIDEIVVAAPHLVGSAPAVLVIQVGDGADPNRYLSVSWSATLISRAISGLGYKYEISDDAAVHYDTIDITIDAGVLSVSQGIDMIVTYHVDE